MGRSAAQIESILSHSVDCSILSAELHPAVPSAAPAETVTASMYTVPESVINTPPAFYKHTDLSVLTHTHKTR